MQNKQKEISIIRKNLTGVRNEEIRSRAMLIIRALQSGNISLTVDRFGCSRRKFYFWINRLRKADYELRALANMSRKPKSNPRMIPEEIIQLAIQVRKKNYDTGPVNTVHVLKEQYNVEIQPSTLGYIFKRKNISKHYRRARKNQHTRRYAAENALERTQQDTVNLNILDNNGNKVKGYPVIDDCSRVATVYVADEHSNHEATNGFKKFVEKFGKPEKSQTDNGVEFTSKYISEENPKRQKKAVRSGYEQYLMDNNIKHKLIRPRTPQLNGKVERFNQTLKNSLKNRLQDGMSLPQIQAVVDKFLDWYNYYRPHVSLNGLTPYQVFSQNIENKVES